MAVRLSQLVEQLGGRTARASGDDPWIRDVKLDSRHVGAGDLFAALPGRTVNGSEFLSEALARGAVAALVPARLSTSPDASDAPGEWELSSDGPALPLWHHEHALRAAGECAALVHGHPGRRMCTIGITGTNGKTTVAHLAGELLERAGKRPAVLGTAGHKLAGGLSLTATHTTPNAPELHALLAKHAERGGDAAVLEISSHAIDQRRTAGLHLDVAVFTNLSRDHLDYHGDMEQYAETKERMFAELSPNASAVVNADDPSGTRMARAAARAGAKVVTYSTRQSAELRASQIDVGFGGTRLLLNGMGISRKWVHLPLTGRFNVENALAAAAAVLMTGASPSAVAEGLAFVSPAPGRMEPLDVPRGGDFRVMVDYAHSEHALRSVLETLRASVTAEARGGRVICVFGCGGDRDRGKRAPMGRAAGELADVAFLTSDNPRGEDPLAIIEEVRSGIEPTRAAVFVEPDRGAAIRAAVAYARAGDLVLIAGKGHETQQILGTERLEFDDRVVAADAVGARS